MKFFNCVITVIEAELTLSLNSAHILVNPILRNYVLVLQTTRTIVCPDVFNM